MNHRTLSSLLSLLPVIACACTSSRAVSSADYARVDAVTVDALGAAPVVVVESYIPMDSSPVAPETPTSLVLARGLLEIGNMIAAGMKETDMTVANALNAAMPDWDPGTEFAEICMEVLAESNKYGGRLSVGPPREIPAAADLRSYEPARFTSNKRVVPKWNMASYRWTGERCPVHSGSNAEADARSWALEPLLSYIQIGDEAYLGLQASARVCDIAKGEVIGYAEPTAATYVKLRIWGVADAETFHSQFRLVARQLAIKLLGELGLI